MCSVRVGFLVCCLAGVVLAQGWLGPERVSPLDTFYDMEPRIAFSPTGVPWVIWLNNKRYLDTLIWYTTRTGGVWDRPRGVFWYPLDSIYNYAWMPDLEFDSHGTPFAVWEAQLDDNSGRIQASCWTGEGWGQVMPVSPLPPDTISECFGPRLRCGGGKLWCVWFGGPDYSGSRYSVWASCWDEDDSCWGPRTKVSPSDGFSHWWGDPWVDELGNPHVVWVEIPHGFVYYSSFDGTAWSPPVALNDTHEIMCGAYGPPRAAMDKTGVVHVAFHAGHSGIPTSIYYARYADGQWSPCERVSQWRWPEDYFPAIAADSPDNVWVAWDRKDSIELDYGVWARHFDGTTWLPEVRIDGDSLLADHGASIALDPDGFPWVFWHGGDAHGSSVFCNRYGFPSPIQEFTGSPKSVVLSSPGPSRTPVVTCWLPCSNRARVSIYDLAGREVRCLLNEHRPEGMFTVRWDGTSDRGTEVSSGVYVCRLEAGELTASSRVVLLAHKE